MKSFLLASFFVFASVLSFDSQAGPNVSEPVFLERIAIEPIAWTGAECKKNSFREPKYQLSVFNRRREEVYRIFSDLCSFPTAQFIGAIFVTDDGVVVGMSGLDGEDFPIFSRHVMRWGARR